MGRYDRTLAERFWEAVDKHGPKKGGLSRCWVWTRYLNPDGYGRIQIAGQAKTVHRVSWGLHFGPIPNGKQVLHECDVRACVRPTHLYLGTHRDNMADMAERGRAPCNSFPGEQNPMARLSAMQVVTIRSRRDSGVSQQHVADEFMVSRRLVGMIWRNEIWRHV